MFCIFDIQGSAHEDDIHSEGDMNEHDPDDPPPNDAAGAEEIGTNGEEVVGATSEEPQGTQCKSPSKKKLFKSPLKRGIQRRKQQEEAVTYACDYLKKKAKELETSSSKSPTPPNNSNDECSMFGQLIAEKLRRMNYTRRQYAMQDVNNVIFKYVIENTSTPTSSPSSLLSPSTPSFLPNYSPTYSLSIQPPSPAHSLPSVNQSPHYSMNVLDISPSPPCNSSLSSSNIFPFDQGLNVPFTTNN